MTYFLKGKLDLQLRNVVKPWLYSFMLDKCAQNIKLSHFGISLLYSVVTLKWNICPPLNFKLSTQSGNSRGFTTIFTRLTRSLGSDTEILPSNAETSKQNRGRATGGYNLITFRAPRINGRFFNYIAKLHYILKCASWWLSPAHQI